MQDFQNMFRMDGRVALVTGDKAAIALAVSQYNAADNMTDRIAGLTALSWHNIPERQTVLDDFYQRFEKDALVIDKWFTLQAMLPEASTLARVKDQFQRLG